MTESLRFFSLAAIPHFVRACAGAAHKRRAADAAFTVSVKNGNGLVYFVAHTDAPFMRPNIFNLERARGTASAGQSITQIQIPVARVEQ